MCAGAHSFRAEFHHSLFMHVFSICAIRELNSILFYSFDFLSEREKNFPDEKLSKNLKKLRRERSTAQPKEENSIRENIKLKSCHREQQQQ